MKKKTRKLSSNYKRTLQWVSLVRQSNRPRTKLFASPATNLSTSSEIQKLKALGHVYSSAGEKEYSLSGLCEYCFDKVFDDAISPGEREIEELESFVENQQ